MLHQDISSCLQKAVVNSIYYIINIAIKKRYIVYKNTMVHDLQNCAICVTIVFKKTASQIFN